MSGPIQTIPQGLLGLLQLKQTGNNPRDLAESVQPTVDQFPLWIQRLSVDISLALFGGNSSVAIPTANAGANFFTTNPLNVPQGVAWYVESYTISASLLAAESVIFAPGVLYIGLGMMHPLTPPVADVVTARARQIRAAARGFWLPPGAALGAFVFDNVTAATITLTGNVRGVQVPI